MNGFYSSDGAKLGFRDTGAGEPVVFLHPTPLDGDYWRPLTENLDGVRAIVPDLRGHGVSELGRTLPVGGFATRSRRSGADHSATGFAMFLRCSTI